MADVISGAESPTPRATLTFRRIVVIGGGCYGSWYSQQLTRAMARGALTVDEIVVVDRNPACQVSQQLRDGALINESLSVVQSSWADYLDQWLDEPIERLAQDAMVPSPMMPHLCLDWLMTRARLRWPDRQISVEPLPQAPPMPWERAAPDGRHYVSFATWTCPVNCIEPERCPATRGPRDWSMPPALQKFAAEQRGTLDHAVIFHCTHRTYGVGMIDALPIAQSRQFVNDAPIASPLRVLVGTVSHCHGALGVLTLS